MSVKKSITNKPPLATIRTLAVSTKPAKAKSAKKPAAKSAARRAPSPPLRDGHEVPIGSKVAIPVEMVKPVSPSKIQANIEKASQPILKMAKEFASRMDGESFAIAEIEFAVSFDADGKFLGVGVGGAASIKIVIAPSAA